jgi:hypothetical protein
VLEPIASNAPEGLRQGEAKNSVGEYLSYLNPLRLVEARASAQASPSPTPNQKISFRKAVTLSTSNAAGDTSTEPRLSRWISYSRQYPDRVTLSPDYRPETGMAFKVTVRDPDGTGNSITYTTSAQFTDPRVTNSLSSSPSLTFGSGLNTTTISYIPVTPSPKTINVSSGSANTDFGRLVVVNTGSGATIQRTRFVIIVNMTKPYQATKEIRGWVEPGSTAGTVNYLLDSKSWDFRGSTLTLVTPSNTYISQTNTGRFGFELPGTAGGITQLNGSMTACEPTRVIVTATGYGPRGAIKRLETVVRKNSFDDLSAPATLTLIGPVATSSPKPNTAFDFAPGSSAVTTYSGDDKASTLYIPPIGTTENQNLRVVQDSVDGKPPHPFNGSVIGTPSNIAGELPYWLQNPYNLDDQIELLKDVAKSSGRYFASGVTPTGFGNNATARGITFADGNVSLTGTGGGLLVVTGKLTLHGNFNFKGLIIVTGQQGVDRSGGGGGTLEGNVVVAPYVKNKPEWGFLAPKYNLSGGGNSEIVYNSNNVFNGMYALSNFVQGVVEK